MAKIGKQPSGILTMKKNDGIGGNVVPRKGIQPYNYC